MVQCITDEPDMNCVSAREQTALELIDVIDFKWLMAHQGHHVHVERLQSDPDYASQCVQLALASRGEALHRVARRLAGSLTAPALNTPR